MGVLGTGGQMQDAALSGLRRAAVLEEGRENTNRQLKAAEKQQKISTTVTGAATGASIGASYGGMSGGPWGAVIGAGVGYLLSEVF